MTKRMEPIPFINPKLPSPDDLANDLRRIYKNNYYSNNGPIYFEFSNALEKYLGDGVKVSILCNATLALMLAMRADFGDAESNGKKYVAMPSFTFAAGALSIEWCGYEPILFDINDQAQPSLDSFKQLLLEYNNKIAGVLLTNSFGIGNPEIDQWADLLNAEGIPYLIDSAPGFGSTYENGDRLGGCGDCEVFSLHVTKPFGIGEGGIVTSKRAEFIKQIESLKNFGFDEKNRTTSLGLNAKITEFECAVGLRLLKNLDNVLLDRRETYKKYITHLDNPKIDFLPRADTAAIQFATIMVPATDRDSLLSSLSESGVGVRTYYAPAVHTFPRFKDIKRTSLPNTELISKKVISLPVHPGMDDETINFICGIINRGLGK